MDDQFIGNYRILKKVGAGGMARVYLAVHRDVPNLKVVLKVLSDPRLVERFKQEADKLALLDGNANICQIKHFFNHGDDIVIAMEYIDGVTLEDVIAAETRLSVDKSLQIVSEVLGTLDFAHQKKVFHRDIKPGNIMLDGKGQTKIIDFGIAKSDTDPHLTMAGGACGTPTYMAPEQFNPTDQVNYALADIYAVGTMLFYMLTGKLPFEGDNPFLLRDAKLSSEPPKPRSLNPDVPKELESVILKAMDKDPEKRFASACQMRREIDALRKSSLTGDKKGDSSTEAASKPGTKKGRGMTVPLLVILLAVVVVAVYLNMGKKIVTIPAVVAPQLYQPPAEAVLTDNFPTFEWEATAGEKGAYILEYADNPEFTNFHMSPRLVRNDYSPAEELPNGKYFWRVKSIDGSGRESVPSATASFSITVPEKLATTPVMSTGSLEITVQPQGDIYVDGRLQGRERKKLDLTLDTGKHSIRIENPNSIEKTLTDNVAIAAGSKQSKVFRFTFPSPTPPAVSGQTLVEVRIGSRPTLGGSVYIDGNLNPRPTPYTYKLTTGKHVIAVTLKVNGVESQLVDTVFIEASGNYGLIFDFEKATVSLR